MTAGELFLLLNALPAELDDAIIIYSPVPGQTVFAQNYEYFPDPVTILYSLVSGSAFPPAFPLTVHQLRQQINVSPPENKLRPISVPVLAGIVEVSGITVYPDNGDGNGPYVSLDTIGTTPKPPGPPDIPANRRKQRGRPMWPDIPIGDP